jgi:hypothetical protein
MDIQMVISMQARCVNLWETSSSTRNAAIESEKWKEYLNSITQFEKMRNQLIS